MNSFAVKLNCCMKPTLAIPVALLIATFGADLLAEPAAVATRETCALKTKSFTVALQVGKDGRLYQHPIGVESRRSKPARDDEFYPQAGDGYIWEPQCRWFTPMATPRRT